MKHSSRIRSAGLRTVRGSVATTRCQYRWRRRSSSERVWTGLRMLVEGARARGVLCLMLGGEAGLWRGGGRAVQWGPMHRCHMGTPLTLWTDDTSKNITFPQLRWQAAIIVQEEAPTLMGRGQYDFGVGRGRGESSDIVTHVANTLGLSRQSLNETRTGTKIMSTTSHYNFNRTRITHRDYYKFSISSLGKVQNGLVSHSFKFLVLFKFPHKLQCEGST